MIGEEIHKQLEADRAFRAGSGACALHLCLFALPAGDQPDHESQAGEHQRERRLRTENDWISGPGEVRTSSARVSPPGGNPGGQRHVVQPQCVVRSTDSSGVGPETPAGPDPVAITTQLLLANRRDHGPSAAAWRRKNGIGLPVGLRRRRGLSVSTVRLSARTVARRAAGNPGRLSGRNSE